jgi:hypothetical protein
MKSQEKLIFKKLETRQIKLPYGEREMINYPKECLPYIKWKK